MLKSAALVLFSNALQGVILFARNILVARLVSVEDYGIAVTFAIVMAAIELATQLGMHQLIVQDQGGNRPRFQAELQGFQLIRSSVMASFCFLAAPLMAEFFGDANLTWAFQALSLLILARGFMHFDIFRLQRRMNFVPMAIMQTLGPLSGLLTVLPLSLGYDDYRVMLFSLIAQEVFSVGLTHLTAERRYRLRLSLVAIRRTMIFGWPLLLNGLLLFLMFHGERMVVLRAYDLQMLALFSMGITVTMTPGLMFIKTFDSLFLPKLSAAQATPARFNEIGHTAIEVSLVMGLVFAGLTQLVTVPMILMIVGDKYSGIIWLMPWITLATAIRLFRAAPSLVLLSKAKTGSILAANLLRIAVLPVSWLVAQNGAGVEVVLFLAILGEVLAQIVSFGLMVRQAAIPIRPVALQIGATSFCAVVLGMHEYTIYFVENPWIHPNWTKIAVAFLGGVTLATTRRFWLMFRRELGALGA